MTLATLRTKVRTRLGVPSGDSFYTDTVLTELINDALQFVSSEYDWWWLEKSETINTASGTSSYSTAADCMRTISLADPTGLPLVRMPIFELEKLTTAESGSVRFYSPYAATLVLRPVPNETLALVHRYIGTEPALSADGDDPLMPGQYEQVLVEYACYLAKIRAGNAAEAAAAFEVYNRWIGTMRGRADRLAISEGGGQMPAPEGPAK